MFWSFRQICEICDEQQIIHDMSSKDWLTLQQLKGLVAPFAAAVKQLEGEHYVTASEVYPILFSLRNKLNKVGDANAVLGCLFYM